jgi:hypothetical protein
LALAHILQKGQTKLNMNEKAKVKDNEEKPRQVSTCFEGSSFAEMMQKIMGSEGIGSLSEEMMRSMIEKLNEDLEESPKSKKEEI